MRASLSFLLGLPGFVFILWSWYDSLTHQAGLFRDHLFLHAASGLTIFSDRITHSDSRIVIQKLRWDAEVAPSVSTQHWYLASKPTRPSGVVFPAPSDVLTPSPFAPDGKVLLRHITIPHWLILLLYGIAWPGLITLHRRRKKRLKKAAALDPSASTDPA